ncbi:hypothetical protein F5884DRAFT_751246 [Xylogone sp. PMI_703]|nr:hypothetical protein F5884DRAFT_751246 [Xylogone sp. PMI_703]
MDSSKLMSTKDVPPQFLKPTMMVGNIPFTALRYDNRISYTLYIPQQHYNPDPTCRSTGNTKDIDPKYLLPPLPLIVNVHGTGRDAQKCRDRLIEFADTERAAVLAPLFPAGLDGYGDLDSFKLLKSKTLRADLGLLQILDEVAAKWPGIETQKFFLAGFSGGGQFVHRFAYLYPEKLHALSVGAPGRATHLDTSLPWPKGIQDVETVFGPDLKVDKNKIRAIPHIQLLIGGEDNIVHGGSEFWTWLAATKSSLKQGIELEGETLEKKEPAQLALPIKGRLDTIKELQETWKNDNISSQLDIVPGIAHDAPGTHRTLEEFLRPLIREFWDKTP